MYKSNFTNYACSLRGLSMLLLACFLMVLLSGCLPGSGNDNNSNRAQGPAVLAIAVGNNQINKALDNSELPDGIDRIVVKVTDNSGATLGEGDILAVGGKLTLSVPSGVVLTIRGLAFSGESLDFQAQTNVGPLIAGISTSVSLTLVPAGANASELNAPIQLDISPDGRSGNALSNRAVFSGDSQIILFKSEADNLVTDDTNEQVDFFLKDRRNNRIINVHTNSDNEQADGAAISADMSANGRVIVFASEAGNFASNPTDDNMVSDVFVKELDTNTTTRISVTSTDEQAPLSSGQPTLSEDGQIAIFVSDNSLTDDGASGIYLKNLSNGELQYLDTGTAPLLSGDGSQVIIWDTANSTLKLYNTTERTSREIVTPYAAPEASEVLPYDIATNGQFVVFALKGSNAAAASKALDEGNTQNSGIYLFKSFLDDRPSITQLISTDSDGVALDTTSSPAITPNLSGDGRYIVYAIGTTIHVKDSTTNLAVQLSQTGALPSLSKNGQWVAYTISDTDNLYIVPNPLFSSTLGSPGTPGSTKILTVTAEGEGSVNSQDGNIACGQQCSYDYADATLVQLTAAAQTGFVLTAWQGDCTGSNLVVSVTLNQARSCTAVFTPENKTLMLTIKGGPNAGSVRSDDGDENTEPALVCKNEGAEESSCNGNFPHGQTVNLMPALGEGKNAVSWTGCTKDNGLNGCTVIMDEGKNITANFVLVEHTLTINKTGAGQGVVTSEDGKINCGDTCSASFASDEALVLIANAASNSVFTGWDGACTGTGSRLELNLTDTASCTAQFDLADFSLSVSSTGSGNSTITSSDNGINCGSDCNEIYTSGATVTLTANAANDDQFIAWSGDEQCAGSGPTVDVTVDGNISCVAEFLVRHELKVSKTGTGSITSNPGGIDCGNDCSEIYQKNTQVTLTAVAGSGFVFTNWSGACSGTNSSTSVTLNAAKSCTANFTKRFTLTVETSGAGTVTSNPGGINCGTDCNQTYNKDTQVTLTAVAGSGFVFTSWGGACSGEKGSNPIVQVTLNQARSCTVVFTPESRKLTLTIKGGPNAGSVRSDDGDENTASTLICENAGAEESICNGNFPHGQIVNLILTLGEGKNAVSWAGCTENKGLNGCTVIMDEGKNITANFILVEYNLTINKAGAGQGVVTSEDGKINCGDTCSASFSSNNTLVLVANAASNSVFTGWEGVCSGTGSRVELNLTDATSCIAKFDLANFSLSVSSTGSSNSTITSSDNGINCGSDCSEVYTSGATVTLTANVANDDQFIAWSGDEQCTGSSSIVDVIVDGNISCEAEFLVRYELNVSKTGEGTITSSLDGINCGNDCSEIYNKDTQVTLAAVASSDFRFVNWSGACSGTNSSTSVTLNAAKSCRANFIQRFTLIVEKLGVGTVTSNPGGINCGADCNQTYNKDTQVTLIAVAGSGFVFTNWSGACSGETSSTSVTLNAEKTCKANFAIQRFTLSVAKSGAGIVTSSPGGIDCGGDCNETYDENTQVTLTAVASSSFVFTSWGGDCSGSNSSTSVTVSTARSCTANFDEQRFTLDVTKLGRGTVTSTPSGISCGGDCSEPYNQGTTVVLSADENAGFVFAGWSGACSGAGVSTTVIVDAAKNCVANFDEQRFTLTVSTSGTGIVTSSPGGINCGENCNQTYDKDTQVILTAEAGSGFRFANWNGACSGSSSSVSVTLNAAKKCTANFDRGSFTLAVTKSGTGTVTSAPGGIDCGGDCNQAYNKDTQVTLTAVADSSFRFANWSGACSGSNSSTVVTLNSAKSCTANFEKERFTLNVSKSGTGTVTSSPGGISCGGDCSETYNKDTQVTLTAVPGSGFRFTNWSGACSGSNSSASVTLNAAKSCRANFIQRFVLTVSNSAANTGRGSVTSSPGEMNCFFNGTAIGGNCNQTYNKDTQVTLTAVAGSGFRLVSWGGACSGSSNSTSVTLNAAKSCTVNFDRERFTLTVTKSGTGIVTSGPGGIDCGGDCNETYDEGTQVTLTAEAGLSTRFVNWSGACSGSNNNVNVTMSAAKSCTANFLQLIGLTTSINKLGRGTVTSDPGIFRCNDICRELYTPGTTVALTAEASNGFVFSRWSGTCSGTGASITVIADTDKSCIANFEVQRFTLSVAVERLGGGIDTSGRGTITSVPGGISCGNDCSESYTQGSTVTLTAKGSLGFFFTGWGGACSGGDTSVTVIIDAAKTCVARFFRQF